MFLWLFSKVRLSKKEPYFFNIRIKKIIFLILIISCNYFFAQTGNDQVIEMLDSLKNIYGYNSITYETPSKYNFKPGEIPIYTNEIYRQRIEVLNTHSPFEFTYNSIVQGYINKYLKSPKSISYLLSKSKFYFPLFEKYLNQFEIPLELKNLAIVESALNPKAKSQCGASGLWQFMYGTAKAYRLEINSYTDERFDAEKETIVACMYLKDLFQIYKSWPLVLAAYNCGPGNVNKAIRKSGKADFWSIYPYLPKETQGYVPAFIAATYVTAYFQEHNIMPTNAPFLYDDLDYIVINKKTTFKELSVIMGVEVKKLEFLNPQYFLGVIPGINDKVCIPDRTPLNLSIVISNPNELNRGGGMEEKKEVIVRGKTDNEKQKFSAKKSVFGTIFLNAPRAAPNQSTDNIRKDFVGDLKNSVTVNAETYSAGSFKDQAKIELISKDNYSIGNVKLEKNNILEGKIYFLKNSAYIKIFSVKTKNGFSPLTLEGEIYQIPHKGKITLDEGYTVLLKYI